MTDWKAEAELLRAQLVTCTTAMREVAGELADRGHSYSVPGTALQGWADKLQAVRGQAVDPHAFQVEHERELACLKQLVADTERNRVAELDIHVSSERNLAGERDEWEQKYRKLAVECASLSAQLSESEETFAWYEAAAKRTYNDAPYAPANAALGLAGEAGEAVELVKKNLFHGADLSVFELTKELGDVLFYLVWLGSQYGISLRDIAHGNIDKLKARYPEGWKPGGGVR